jgi:hypothetical protein
MSAVPPTPPTQNAPPEQQFTDEVWMMDLGCEETTVVEDPLDVFRNALRPVRTSNTDNVVVENAGGAMPAGPIEYDVPSTSLARDINGFDDAPEEPPTRPYKHSHH